MKVVLIQDYPSLGKKGEIKNVSDGFARNFLLPRKISVLATDSIIEKIKQEELRKNKEKQEINGQKRQLVQKIAGQVLNFNLETSETGTLFSALNKEMIVNEIYKLFNFKLNNDNIIPEEPIKKIGDYEIGVNLGDNYKTNLKIKVKSKNVQK